MNGYIALEGVNGVGKSTIIEELKRRVNTLREDQTPIHFTREVGGCPEAEMIRDFLTCKKHLSPQGKEALIWTARTQLARFLDRNHKGSTVISDRCWVSTFVYNSTSLESTLERVEVLREVLAHGLECVGLTHVEDLLFDPRGELAELVTNRVELYSGGLLAPHRS